MRPSLASFSLHFLFPSFFLRESFLKKIKTTKLQVALPPIFVIIMEPWSHAFLHTVSHIERTKKTSYMDTGNVLGGRLITQHQCHFLLHCPLNHSGGSCKHTLQKSSPVHLGIRICLSEALHKVWKPERSLASSRQTRGQSADVGVSRKALENHLLQSCKPVEFLDLKL